MKESELDKLVDQGAAGGDLEHFSLPCSCCGQCGAIKFAAFSYVPEGDPVRHVLDDWDVDVLLSMNTVSWWLRPWQRIKMAASLLWNGYTSFSPICVDTEEMQKFGKWLRELKKVEDDCG